MSSSITTATSPLEFDGRWTVEYSEVDGEMVPVSVVGKAFLIITGNKFQVEKNGAIAYEGTYTTKHTAHPAEITLHYTKSEKPQFLTGPRPGVYQLDGDTFKTCFGMVGQGFPKALSTFPGSQSAFTVHVKEGTLESAAQAAVIRTPLW